MPSHANERPTQSGSAPRAGFAMRQPPAPGSRDANGQGRDPNGQGPNGDRDGSAPGGGSGRPRPGAGVPRPADPGQPGHPSPPLNPLRRVPGGPAQAGVGPRGSAPRIDFDRRPGPGPGPRPDAGPRPDPGFGGRNGSQ